MGKLKSFFQELKKRNIYKVGAIYAITAFIVVQIAQLLVPAMVLPEWFYRVVVAIAILGFPLALVIAWAFEITPEGVQRTSEREEQKQISERNFWFGTGIITIIILSGWWYLTMESTTSSKSETSQNISDRSIAVLPLKSVSGRDDPLPLAEGLHDDLLTRLANVGELKVISRTSVEKFKGTKLTLPAIADSLGVKWILEGGVQKGGNKVQINAQLIDPSNDTHIWAETYQRDLNAADIFAIQGAIAREIAGALQAKLSAGEQDRIAGAPTSNINAYKLYVRGRNLYNQGTTRDEAIQSTYYFGKALQQDSTFALAWAGLADLLGSGLNKASVPDSLYIPNVTQKQAAQRALDLAPNLAEAHSAMGTYYSDFYNKNAPAALHHYRKAIALKPSYAEAHQKIGGLLLAIGKPTKSLKHLQLSEELDPTHLRGQVAVYDALMVNKQYEKALKIARRYRRQYPDIGGHLAAVVRNLVHLDRYQEADSLTRQGIQQAERFYDKYLMRTYLIAIKAVLGETDEAQDQLEKLNRLEIPSRVKDYAYALQPTALAALGKIDAAFEAYDKVNVWPYFAHVEIRYDYFPAARSKLKNDPRHKNLLREINKYIGLHPDGSLPEEPNL
jgi:TolB-like protein/Tfp pilus assembly protein PilF